MHRVSGRGTRAALRQSYPGADVQARREFGGTVTASVYQDSGTFCVSADTGGMLAYLLGLDLPSADPGGESLDARPVAHSITSSRRRAS